MQILDAGQEKLVTDERRLLSDLRVSLVRFGATPEDQRTLQQSIQQLDELFLLVVVGEFNAGKSSLINALLGQKLLKEGVTPTTTQINILRYAEQTERGVENPNIHALAAPIDLLRELSIVDTPGTNAVIREHEAITTDFIPRADLVLFITSADRPFTESERAFLELIRDWGKKVVVAVNKVDILQSEDDVNQVLAFVADHARELFGLTPEIFPVSARLALRAKLGEPDQWAASRFEPLERYMEETLDQSSRVRLKLLNPLGVGQRLVEKFLIITVERLSLLGEDITKLEDVDAQLKVYQADMQRDFNYRMADIENILFAMEQRGQDYFDETIRLLRLPDLLNRERTRQEFQRVVIADSAQQIETRVDELIDWLVESDFRQWQAVMEHLAERRRAHHDRIIGDPGVGSFHSDRERLMEALGSQAQRVVETYDRSREADQIAGDTQTAVAALAAVEVGALGLGALLTALATTAAADATGILLASVVALLGLFVIPARRRQAKEEMRVKIANMREQLIQALRSQFENEIGRSDRSIHEAIAPYDRFVRSEREKLGQADSELRGIQNGMSGLKVRIEDMFSD